LLTAAIAFLLGVFFAPVIRPLARPILIEIIKAGLMVGDEVRRMSAQVREGMDDARAEAAASAERAQAKTQQAAAAQPAADAAVPPPATPAQ